MIRLFYTGGTFYLQEQRFSIKSIGGFISSSPVPNGSFEAFFSDISNLSILENLPEYKMFALKNEGTTKIQNLRMYYIYPENQALKVLISAIKPSKQNKGNGCEYYFEKVPNMRSAPIYSQEFHEADSQVASARVEFLTPAILGERITLLGVQTQLASKNLTLDETYKLVETSFKNNTTYTVTFINKEVITFNAVGEELKTIEKYLLIKKKNIGEDTTLVTFSTTGSATVKTPLPSLAGGYDNSINLGDIEPGEYLGIWFKKELLVDNILSQPVLPVDKIPTELGLSENIELYFEY